ncbi:MAG: HigA family addiction module antidote protein [Rhodobacteraceae bacterium]|nr:HigA family addiction module antidote protein [Paracoccaceae bacterium]
MVLQNPVHPGEILKAEFLAELGLSAGNLAKAARVPLARIEGILRQEMDLTADMAIRLSKYLGTSPEFWLNLQRNYDHGIATS